MMIDGHRDRTFYKFPRSSMTFHDPQCPSSIFLPTMTCSISLCRQQAVLRLHAPETLVMSKMTFLGTRSGHQIFTHKPVDSTVFLFAYRDIVASNW